MICPAASVDWDSTGYRIPNLDPRRFGIINADTGARVRLKSSVSRCESQDEVPHERACIDPSGNVALCDSVTKAVLQGEVSATAKAIVKEVAFNRWTNYARAKDVTQFNAAVKADVILWRDCQSVAEILRTDGRAVGRKCFIVSAVLKDISAHIDRAVETESVKWWRARCDLLIGLRSGLNRSGAKSC